MGEPSDLPLPPAVSLSFPTWREGVQQHLCLLPWGGTEAGGGPCKPFSDRAFGPVCRNEEHGGAHSKPPTVSRTQHDKEGSISLKDFRGTPGALRRHSAQCPAPGKSSMGGLVRIVYLGKNNCHRLSSGLSSSEVLADTPPPQQGPLMKNWCPEPRAVAGWLAQEPPRVSHGDNTQPLVPGCSSFQPTTDDICEASGEPVPGSSWVSRWLEGSQWQVDAAPLGSDTSGFKPCPALSFQGPWQVTHPVSPISWNLVS